MHDVAANLNCFKPWFIFSVMSKSFSQAIKMYGGRHMYNLFSLNFSGSKITTTKREDKPDIQFISSEHAEIFRAVADIYKCAKDVHGISRPIPVILAEDETKVKVREAWKQKWDTLSSFYGIKENHVCITNDKPVIGFGEARYKKVLHSFQND